MRGDKITSKDLQEQEALVQKDPSNLRALHKLGDLYAKAEQVDQAIETYKQAAKSYIERAFYQKAVAVYKQILKLNPAMYDVQEQLAEVYVELGRRSDALSQYQTLARKYETTGSTALATGILKKMLQLDEENVPLRVKLAELYLTVSDKDGAINEFELALNTLANREKWADYIKVGERLLFIAPEHLGALKTIARVYLDHDDVMQAMGKLQQAFKLERRDPETLEVLAVAFDRLEQPEKTISVLKELADIYKEMGRNDYVRDVYQQIIERNPNDAEILAALEDLPEAVSVPSLPAAEAVSNEELPSEPLSVPADRAAMAMPPAPVAPPTPPPLEPSLSLSQEEVERLLNEADVYIKYGLVPRVEEALNRIFAAYPQHAEARRLRVELLRMQERSEEAAIELLQLATESQDDANTLTLLEQILELEDISTEVQEDAYQMMIRLKPKAQTDPAVSAPPQAPPAPPVLSSSAASFDEIEAIPTDDSELDIISIEDLDSVVELDSEAVIDGDSFSYENGLPIPDELDPLDEGDTNIGAFQDTSAPPSFAAPPTTDFPEISSFEELDAASFEEIQEVDEFEIIGAADGSSTPQELPASFQEEEEPEDPFATAAPSFSAPAPPAPPSFAPPAPEPQDDPFGTFLARKRENDPIEEEDMGGFADFLSTPLEVEAPEPPPSSLGLGGGSSAELSDMEAAAARLQALIAAKEEAEKPEPEPQKAAAAPSVPAPFAPPPPPPPPFESKEISVPAPFAIPQDHPVDIVEEEEDPTTLSPTMPSPTDFEENVTPADEFVIEDEDEAFLIDDEAPTPSNAAIVPEPPVNLHEQPPSEGFEAETFSFGDDDAFDDLDDAFGDIADDEPPLTLDESDPYLDEIEEAGMYLDQDEPQYAIEIFDRILQADPNHTVARAGLEMALEAEQKLQQEKSDALSFDIDSALGGVATTKRERARVEDDLKAFQEETQKQFSGDGETLYELGMAYHEMALFEMSIKAFQDCIDNRYRECDSYKMIGSCYISQGQNQSALQAFQNALALPHLTQDERIDVLFELGQAHENDGNPSDALSYYEEVSQLDASYRGVQDRIHTLRG